MKKFFNQIAKSLIFHKYRALSDKINLQNVSSCSDLFFYRNDNFSTTYIQENTKSLYSSNISSFSITIVFFNKDGKELFRVKHKLHSFDFTINFDMYSKKLDKYGSFLIFTSEKLNFIPHFRGYVGYKRKLDEHYSFVHGNFGALYVSEDGGFQSVLNFINNKTFNYSPQLEFKQTQTYIISNPFLFDINVTFSLYANNNLNLIETKTIQPFATTFFVSQDKLLNGDVTAVFSSHIPALRPIIFDEYKSHFDVLHS